jgi:hypothetical protein
MAMSDLVERLRRAAKHEDGWAIMADAADEIDRLLLELHESDDLRERLAAILTATANALKGQPKTLHAHSWHDLSEVAARIITSHDNLLARIECAPTAIAHAEHYGGSQIFGPGDMDGKRVALVVIE